MAGDGLKKRRPYGISDDEGFASIGIADDLMFKEVFGKDPALAGRLLEVVLGRPVGEVEFVHPEHEVRSEHDAHGTRFDVYLRTKQGVYGDLEMQTTNKGDLPLRLRAYLSNMDRATLKRGRGYREISEAVSVFICTFDPLGKGLTRYTVRRCVQETGDVFEDRQTGILLNATGPGDDVPADLSAFLRYVSGYDGDVAAGGNDFVGTVDDMVRRTRADWDWRQGYMTLQEKIDDAKAEGIEQGRAEGGELARLAILRRIMEASHVTAAEAMDVIFVPEEDRPRIMELLEG